ncbi:hypothetical protein H4219_006392 [Mycoemilia scoparia]|uniref:DUF1684 domain-containing protein n=1 Tax=Mycoemilia scoparia TaxID=417184 RepID=A0A9W7ZSN2_9FUNG|nr:hypothetical protein H4219_006392 [Mycoemilia scoparia]
MSSSAVRIDPTSQSYLQAIEQWHVQRNNFMKRDWLTLAGLVWIPEKNTKYTIGSDASKNDIEFPGTSTPAQLGALERLDNDRVRFTVTKESLDHFGDDIKVNDEPILAQTAKITTSDNGNVSIDLVPDSDVDSTNQTERESIVSYGSVTWYAIKRAGDRVGIRVKDSQNPPINQFQGIKYYPTKPEYVVDAQWQNLPKTQEEGEEGSRLVPKKLKIANLLGDIRETFASGYLRFKLPNDETSTEYKLYVEGSPDKELFVLFRDGTSGKSTYGSGRFIRINKPDPETGKVQIDFNKAFNPPCAFTPFATCPLPPMDNWLHLQAKANAASGSEKSGGSVEAGETVESQHHL